MSSTQRGQSETKQTFKTNKQITQVDKTKLSVHRNDFDKCILKIIWELLKTVGPLRATDPDIATTIYVLQES